MKRVPISFFLIFICVALLGGSSCALYEEFEPLGAPPDGSGARNDTDTDPRPDAGADGVGPEVDADAHGDVDSGVEPAPVERIEIEPSMLALNVGEDAQLTATLYGADDAILSGHAIDWSSSDAEVVSVDEHGFIQALREGSATIRASSDGEQAEVSVTVDASVSTVTIQPRQASVGVSETIQLNATVRDALDNELSGRAVTWEVSDENIAMIDGNGLAFGVVGGTVTITAHSEGVTDTTELTVANPVATIVVSPDPVLLPVLGTQQLSATLRDAGGNPLIGRVITWRSEDSSIASVDASGVVTGKDGGVVAITASAEGVTASTQVTVENVVTAVDISPSAPRLEVTETMPLSAIPKNIRGNVISGRSATWTSSNPSVVQVDASGVITAKKGGTASISAQIDSITGTAEVTVDAPLHALLVSPDTPTVEVTQTRDLGVVFKDKGGNTITHPGPVAWTSEDDAIASVASNGRVTAHARGSVTVHAEVDGIVGDATIIVESLPHTLSVSPNSVVFDIHDTRELVAEVFDRAGEPMSGLSVQWASQDTQIATVSSSGSMTGEVRGEAEGTTSVTATVDDGRGGSVVGSASVTTNVSVDSVELLPGSVALFPGEQAQFDARALDGNSDEISGISIDWSVADSSVATVDANGLVSAVAFGSTQITAQAQGKSTTATINVVRWEQISAHHHYSCGVLSNGKAYCWGRNNADGLLGNGSTDSGVDNNNLNGDADAHSPTLVSGGIEFASVTTGLFHTCGLTPTGKAYCWGAGGAGHLGQGQNVGSPVPVAVSGSYEFVDIQVGANHTCALDDDQEVYCWGYNAQGQLGAGSPSATSYSSPKRISGYEFVSLAVGSDHTCAVSKAGPTYCWGLGPKGQLGDGSGGDGTLSHSPVQVDTSEVFESVSAGYNFTCGITAAGEIYCWGANIYGELGDGSTTERWAPVRADASHTYEELHAGGASTCARDAAQEVYCWGFNGQGNLGIGTTTASEPARVLVSGGYQWRDFTVGLQHTCGLTDGASEAFCWGDNDNGQLGNGLVQGYLSVPTEVLNP